MHTCKSNIAVLCFIPFVQIFHCLSVISIYKGTREVFLKILWNSFGCIKPSRKHCKIDASSSNTVLSTRYSVLHNDSLRQVTKVGMNVSFYCKTVLKSQGVFKTVASHRRQIKEALECQWQKELWQHNAYFTDKCLENCQKTGVKKMWFTTLFLQT